MSTSDFKSASVGSYKYSNYFWMYGVKWRIGLNPNGDTWDHKGHISLWLNVYDLGPHKEIDAHFTFDIKEKYDSYKSGSNKFTHATGSGWNKFCSNNYLPGTITIECTIKPKCDDMTVLFRPMTNRMNELKSQLESMRKEKNNIISDLRKEMKTLKDDKIAGLEQKLRDASDYIPNAIENAAEYIPIPIEAIDVSTDHKSDAERTEPCEEDAVLYDTHFNLILDWNSDTDSLRKFQTICSFGTDDDDSKQEGLNQSIFDQYFEAQSIIKKQKERIDLVTTDEHLLQLVNHQNKLSVEYSSHQYQNLIVVPFVFMIS